MSRILSISQEHELLQKLESAGLTSELAQKIITSKDNKLAKKVIEFLKMQSETRVKISDYFGHGIAGQIPQYMSDSFLVNVFIPYKDMEITLPKILPTLNEYVLPNRMSDSKIQENTSSKPMSLEEYYLSIYILIILNKADKSKAYIFHVQVKNRVLVLRLSWNGHKWSNSDPWSFDGGDGWVAGGVFVSLPL